MGKFAHFKKLKKMKRVIITLAVIVSIGMSNIAFGQAVGSKLGHINSAELLSLMPEVKDADAKLKAEAENLDKSYNDMVKEYQTKAQEIQSQIEAGTMDDLIKETKIKEIQETEKRIGEFQMSAQEKVAKRKEELYAPILEKADKAIKAVSEREGYTYIFDSSLGVILFAGPDSVDVLPQVKAEMGIQ